MDTLTNRQLNRATLARQMLLERTDRGIVDTVRFLGGLQSQQTNDPYIALWSRLSGFNHAALTALIVGRDLVRATSMRGTLHLHTPDDMMGFRMLVQPQLDAMWKSNFLKNFGDNDRAKVHRAGVKLLDKSPMTSGDLGKALQAKFPSGTPLSKSILMQVSETLIQIPPTRIWGNGAAPLLTRIENWLPPPYEGALSRKDLVRRYLAAFGPASINDMQIWCRLTKLNVEFEALKDELVTFVSADDGRTLYDLPDAPRPDADTPAAIRFLPLYENVYLGYDNRMRMLVEGHDRRTNLFANFKPAVLIDGVIGGGWAVSQQKHTATLKITPYRKVSKKITTELQKEGDAFLRFMAEAAETFEVNVLPFK